MAFNKNKVIASAQRYVQKGQIGRAIKEYLFVVEMDAEDTRTWLRIADLYVKSGDLSQAIQTYKRVADYYGDKGFFTKGVAVYKNILSIDPANLDAHLNLGEFYVQLGLAPDAIRQFQTVVGTYERDGRHTEGLALLKRIVDLAPDNEGNRIRLAEAYARAGQTDLAAKAFQEVLTALYARSAHDDYIQVAERLVYLAPEELDTVRQLSEVYLLKNDPKRALARLQSLFKSDPSNPTTLDLLGRAFAQIGQAAKAVSVYRELARIHDASGDDAARIGAFQAILSLSPNDPDALAATGGPGGELPATPSMRPASAGGSIEEALSNEELAKRYLADAEIYRKYKLDEHAFERLKAIFEFEPGNADAAVAFRELAQELERSDAIVDVFLTASDAIAGIDPQRAMVLLGEVLQLQPDNPGAAERMRELSAGMDAALPKDDFDFDVNPVDDSFNMDLDLDEIEFDDGLSDQDDGLAFEMDPVAPPPDDDAFGDLLDADDEFADLLESNDGAGVIAPPAPASDAIVLAPPPPSDDFGDLLGGAAEIPADASAEFGGLLAEDPAPAPGDGFDSFDDFDDLLGEDPAQSHEFGGVLQDEPVKPSNDDFGDLLAGGDNVEDFGDLLGDAMVPEPQGDSPPPLVEFEDDSVDGDEATIALNANDLNLASLIAQSSGPAPVEDLIVPPPPDDAGLDEFLVGLGAGELENHGDLFDEVDQGTLNASTTGGSLMDDSVAPPAPADDLGELIGRRPSAPASAISQPMQFVGDSSQDVSPSPTHNPVKKPRGRRNSMPPLPRRPSRIGRTATAPPLGPPKPPPPLAPRKRSVVEPPPPPSRVSPPPEPDLISAPLEPEPISAPPEPELVLESTPPPAALPPEMADFDEPDVTEARPQLVPQPVSDAPAAESFELLDGDMIELEDDDFDIADYEEPDSLSGSIADSMASLSGASAPPASIPPPPMSPPNTGASVDLPDLDDSDFDDDDATIMGPIGGGFGLPPPPLKKPPAAVLEDDGIDETVALNASELTGGPIAEELAELDFLIESDLRVDASDLLGEFERKYGVHPDLAKRRALLNPGVRADDAHDELLDSIEANEADFATIAGAQLSDLSHDDSSTHFDLGVAFKEMGQYAKAIEQLEIAARSPDRRTDAMQIIALCHREGGHPARSAETLVAALASPGLGPDQRHELRYDLATAYEEMGDTARAVEQLESIASEAGDGFRDLKARLARLGA